ncbi:MAG: hypothetical protein Harvfovirus25_11, partial [Harvfovirus sp.]
MNHLHVAQLNSFLAVLRELQFDSNDDDEYDQGLDTKKARDTILKLHNILSTTKIKQLRIFLKSIKLLSKIDVVEKYSVYDAKLRN